MGHESRGSRVSSLMGQMGHGTRGSRVSSLMGQMGHGSRGSRVSSLMGQMGHGSRGSWVSSLMGQMGHGTRGSWVSSLMGQMDHGPYDVTRYQLCRQQTSMVALLTTRNPKPMDAHMHGQGGALAPWRHLPPPWIEHLLPLGRLAN